MTPAETRALRQAWIETCLEEVHGRGPSAQARTALLARLGLADPGDRPLPRDVGGRPRRVAAAAAVLLAGAAVVLAVAWNPRAERDGLAQGGARSHVLYLAGTPSWEFRYLSAWLRRRAEIRAHVWLQQDRTEAAPTAFDPRPTAAQVAAADVILIGDVRWADAWATPLEAAEWWSALEARVRGGAGVVVLEDAARDPQLWQTPFGPWLPVAASVGDGSPLGSAAIVTAAGAAHPLLVGVDGSPSGAQWRVQSPHHGGLGAARAGGTVLLRTDEVEGRPLLVVGGLGRGRTAVLGVALWRLRDGSLERYDRAIDNLIGWLGPR